MADRGAGELVVAGGGIGGLTAALAVARTGRPVRVLEQASEFGEIGAGIQLGPNATRILDGLGIMGDITDVGVLTRRLVLGDALTGDELTWMDVTDFPERYGGAYVVLHRADLLRILLEACVAHDVALERNAEVVAVENLGGRAAATCRDGRVFEGVAVIGADGLHSVVRPLFSQDELVCSGYVAYRGAVPIDQVSKRSHPKDMVVFIGPGLHFVQYALRAGDFYNQVAVFRSDAYSRGEEDWGTPEELDERFSATCAHVRAALPAIIRDQRWQMSDREPVDTWVRGRIALLGDAAHPMLQYLAQGACQAIEDAGTLAAELERHAGAGGGDGVEAGLLAYQALRAPRTAQVQRNARTWGEIWHVDGVPKLIRDELLRQRTPDDHTHVKWLYG